MKLAPLLAIAVVLLFIWWHWQTILQRYLEIPPDDLNLARRGQYGDSYGSLNTLFAGFALVVSAYAILLQAEEGAEREKERAIADNLRQQDERRRDGETKQRDAEKTKDDFEQNFFRLFQMWHSHVLSLEYSMSDPYGSNRQFTWRGQTVMAVIWNHLSSINLNEPEPEDPKELFMARYKQLYEDNINTLAPAFRMLYYTFRYIAKANIEDKKEYADMVRGTLSPAELKLLAVNCLLPQGAKFKILVEQFHLFKHLPPEGFTEYDEVKKGFHPDAFGD